MHSDNLLRQSRLGKSLTIDDVVARTRVPRVYIEMIDSGRISELPSGLYGRSYVRAFAAAVGVDADQALTVCAADLVEAPDPLPALREIARERVAPTLVQAIKDHLEEWQSKRRVPETSRFGGVIYLAGTIDVLLLFGISAFVVGVGAHACDVSVDALLRHVGGAVVVVCAYTWIMYFALLAGIGGQTIGMQICGARLQSETGPLNLRRISGRAARAALAESSIVVDWLHDSELPARRESPV
jgi:hypothetical protein